MANTLRFKRGLVSGIPTAALGEPLFTTDTFDLYIGNGTGNTRFQKYIASGTTSQLLRGDGSLLTMPIVLTSPSNGQVLKYNGTSWVNDSDAGITGSGTTNYLPKFTGATTLGNSLVYDNGTNVGIGTASPTEGKLVVSNSGPAIIYLKETSVGINSIWNSSDGSLVQFGSVSNHPLLLLTNNTQRARITAGGNFIINNPSTDNGLRFQVTGDGYFSGSVGIGTSSLTGVSLNVSKNITGAIASIGIVQAGQVQTDVTSVATGFRNVLNTAASTPLGDYYHIRLGQGTIGAGTTLTQQIGLYINDFANGTSRYGILSELSAGTGKWNLYMGGTAANYLNGSLSIGTTSTSQKVNIVGSILSTVGYVLNRSDNYGFFTGASDDLGIYHDGTNSFISNATGALIFNNPTERMRLDASGNLGLGVVPSAWSITPALQVVRASIYNQGDDGTYITSNGYYNASWKYISNSTATQYQMLSGQHIWKTAPSGSANANITFTQAMTLFATGNLGIGVTSDATYKLDVNGTMRVSGASTFSSSITQGIFNQNTPVVFTTDGTDNSPSLTIFKNTTLSTRDVFRVQSFLNAAGVQTVASINSGGAATFSSSVTAASFIPTDTTAPTNGLYLPATNTLAWATNTTERMRITNTGLVGIGTNNPITPLHISSTGESAIRLQDTDGTSQYFDIGHNGGISYFLSSNGASLGQFIWYGFNGSVSERMRLTANGNLLINTTTDSGEKIRVNGTILISNATIFSYSGLDGTGALCGTSSAHPYRLVSNNVERLQVKTNGQVRFVPLSAAPSGAEAGDVYYNSTDNKLYCYNGTSWNALF